MLEKIVNQIPFEDLIKGQWYLGRGRNSNIGYFDGENFLTICSKMERWVVKKEGYYTEKEGCFQPFYLLDEGEMIEPFGEFSWDKHYGKRLKIKFFF